METDSVRLPKSRGNDKYSAQLKSVLLQNLESDNGDNPLLALSEKLSDQELIDVFPFYPGNDQAKEIRRWLRQELSKWKNTPTDKFSSTIQKLYIYCVISGKSPNEVLLSDPHKIEFMDWESIRLLVEEIRLKHNIESGRIIPVAIDISCLRMAFLHLYPKAAPGYTFKKDILAKFSILSWEPMWLGNTKNVGLTSVGVNGESEADVTITGQDYLQDLRARYDRCKEKLQDRDELIRDVQDMYTDFDFWKKCDRSIPFLKWFPPKQDIKIGENLPRKAMNVDEQISASERRRDQQIKLSRD